MLAFLLLAASAPELVPVRWFSADPKSLDLLKGTVANCVLVERAQWAAPFNADAAKRNIATFAVIRPAADSAGKMDHCLRPVCHNEAENTSELRTNPPRDLM